MSDNKRNMGLDALAGRPTLLHVFAAENGGASALADLMGSPESIWPG
jgi:hypothetical protein